MWIRSQDKEILLEISYLDVYSLSENNWTIEDCGNDLGTYKSKERAIEVLDEIQEFIMMSKTTQLTTIYEMPEE